MQLPDGQAAHHRAEEAGAAGAVRYRLGRAALRPADVLP